MRKHCSLILSIILVIIATSVYYLSVRSTASPYTGRSSDSFLCTSSCKQYPLSAEQISVTVSNTGDYSGEIDKPILEQKRGNTWYSVKPEELHAYHQRTAVCAPRQPQDVCAFPGALSLPSVPGRIPLCIRPARQRAVLFL